MDEKDAEEKKLREQEARNRIALTHYNLEKEQQYKRSYTCFGKMILAEEKTYPMYSLGKAKRFAQTGEMVTIAKDTPGPVYDPADEEKYKYKTEPRWRFGKSKRPKLNELEVYEYYNHPYKAEEEIKEITKGTRAWDRKVGGAMSLEPRTKYKFSETTPGPGRYEPDYRITKPRDLTYYFGEKTESLSLKLLTGTTNEVGPGSYNVEKSRLTSIHTKPPEWHFGKGKRQELYNKKWTTHETYDDKYSSVSTQYRSKKRTEPQIVFGHATREKERLRGIFPSMMENSPTKVRIPLPKF